MGKVGTIARRGFLLGAVAVAGGAAFGYWRYRTPFENPLAAGLAEGEAALTPYVKVAADGITIYSPRSEMGQGVLTTLPALVAEELDVDLADVKVQHAPAGDAYFNTAVLEETLPFPSYDRGAVAETARGVLGVAAKLVATTQTTGGSSSVPDAYEKLRTAGAAARVALIRAAAARLGVEETALKTESGAVIAPDGSRIPYADLAGEAATVELPDEVPLKPRSEWRLLGKSQPRNDMVAKSTGTATFGVDVRREGMHYATVRMNPRIGGEVLGFDATAAEAMRGVKKIAAIPGGIAVIATNTWYAMEAARAIDADWGEAPYPPSTEEHLSAVEASFTDD
ncbi:MAG: xanthine dehydrogenase family protein molybdopterin-binding subunit, partial [Pseudomonadota bacterium]